MTEHVIAGRYRVIEQLGKGGMGVVWRADDLRLERVVALKVLHAWVADDPELRERFEREASALARLSHPSVVRLYDVLEDRGQTVLVMELVEGVPLDTLLAGRTLDWAETRRLCAPAAAALAHAHARGVVHRDLTPSNVLVERSGRVVVTDFGLARLARGSRRAPVSGVLAGTPEYWAPEQAAGHETGPATDLYSLGCVLFRCLSGRLPFEGEDRLATGLRRAHEHAPSLAEVAASAPDEAVTLVDRLLERSPALRGDAVEAALALGASPGSLPASTTAAAPVPVPAPEPVTPETLVTRVLREPATIVHRVRSHRAPVRRRVALAMLALAVTVGLAGGGVYAVASEDPPGVAAPDVVGMGVDAARAEVSERARKDGGPTPRVKVVDRSYSETAPVGIIVGQDPPDGDRIPERRALLVSVSRGSAFADVPSVAGLDARAAVALLERNGFTPTRRYAPSTAIEAWHAVESAPAEGTSVERPARVTLVVSTGPPKRVVPSLRGLDVDGAIDALEERGFVANVEERATTETPPGAILASRPTSGTRATVGSTVTVLVARAPVWEASSRLEGTEDVSTEPIVVPAGARLVLSTVDTSPLGFFGGSARVALDGDVEGETEVDAGESIVLAEPSGEERTIEVQVDVDGSVHWTVAVEVSR